jgi:hypothetical protein
MQKALKTVAEVFQQQNRQQALNSMPETSNALEWTCRV